MITRVNELKDSEIEVMYGIDQKQEIYSVIDVFLPNEPLPNMDAIVVTAITFMDEIETMLRDKVTCSIIYLEDILYEV